MKKILAGVAAVFFLAGVGGVANANLIDNGSFETPNLNNSWSVYSSIAGWTALSGAGIEIQDNVAGSSYDGTQHVELDSHNNSTMEQLVDTILGEQYLLSFYYSPRPGVAEGSNGIIAYWDGVQLGDVITGTTIGNTNWIEYNFSILGGGYNTSLQFSATGTSDSFGGYLDAVSLIPAPVPEPATMLLFGTGLAGLASARFRKKKK